MGIDFLLGMLSKILEADSGYSCSSCDCACVCVCVCVCLCTCVCVLVAQSCTTLCDPMDCNLPGSLCPWDSPGKNTGVGCRSLLRRIFPTQGLNLGLLYCRFFTI